MDTTPETGEGATTEPDDSVLDVATATEDELIAEYDVLSEEIAGLEAEPATLHSTEEIDRLKLQRNTVTTAINALRTAPRVADEPLAPAPVAETPATDDDPEAAPEAAPEVAAAEPEPEVEAPAPAPVAEVIAEPAQPVPAVAEAAPAEPVEAPAPAAQVDESPTVAPEAIEAPVVETPAALVPETVTPASETASTDHGVEGTTSTPEEPTVDTNTPQSDESPAGDGAEVVAAAESIVEAGSQELVGAGAHTAAVGADARPLGPADSFRPTPVGYRAGGGQSVYSQGVDMGFTEIGRAMESVKSRRPSPTGGSLDGVIASLPAFDETDGLAVEPLTNYHTAIHATALINETVAAWKRMRKGELARTAAICAPLDILRDIPKCGVTDTPFSDLFPQRPIGRLGFQYIPQMSAEDTNEGIAVWTEANQAAIVDDNSATWKPVIDIECADPISVKATEITVGARVDNATEMSQPEHVEEFMHKLAVQRARRREQYLLGKFDALASAYTFTASYGAVAALFESVNSLMPRLVYGERLDEGDYDLVLEPGHLNKLLNDEAARVFGDTTERRRAGLLNAIKEEIGVSKITLLRDLSSGSMGTLNPAGDPADAMPTLYDVNRVRLVPASAFLYAATGEEATGWQTDPQLVRQNRTQWFSKEWVLLAKHGCHPAAFVDLTSCGNGSRANGVTPVACTGQAS